MEEDSGGMYSSRPFEPRRRISAKHVLAILAALSLLLVLAIKGWYEAATDPSHWVAVVDELPIPESWAIADNEVGRNLIMSGPSATRYYFVDAEPEEIAEATTQLIASVGFRLDPAWSARCGRNGTMTTGPVTCQMAALRGSDHLWITIYDRDETAVYYVGRDQHAVEAPNRAVLRIIAAGNY